MYCLESDSTNPHHNLALEQRLFDSLGVQHDVFMLWRNDNAVIVGKHQNTVAEINTAYVRENNISVVRRLSGGGAVYHDLGNVNFTFITRAGAPSGFDFSAFCRPILNALAEFGVTAELSGRNDMTIGGKKFSGNAQYSKQGRVMHHGTILYDSDLAMVEKVLVVPKDKIASKGLASVRSRVTNVKEHMRREVSVEEFMRALSASLLREFPLVPYTLTPEDAAAVAELRRERYDTWDWNYGRSPAYKITKERRVEGVGSISAHMDVNRGVISGLAFFGDYFGNGDTTALASLLAGRRLEHGDLQTALAGVTIGEYFHNLDQETFIAILLQ